MTTDTDTIIEDTAHVDPDNTAEIHKGERPPSEAYADARTIEDTNAVFKSNMRAAAMIYGGMTLIPRAIAADLAEDHRRAMVQRTVGRRTTTSAPRVVIPVAAPVEHDDGRLTITCVGACAQELDVKKFATLKTGGRSSECRSCAAARKATTK